MPEGEGNGKTSPYPKYTIAVLNSYQAGVRYTSERPTWGWTSDEDSQSWVPVWNTVYLWPQRPAVNLLSVAARAKGNVVLGVHVKRQTGGALNSAVSYHCKKD